ncbi:MAG: hypothetical protein K2X49_29735 [Acetobacteraceae bacterium]|nr:hypothetical protein [Acetobacteraceae bacterium]
MTERRKVLVAIGLLVPTAAAAHLPPGAAGPQGGQVQVLGPYQGELTVFLFDHRDRPLDARLATGTAVVLAEGQQQSLAFAPRADGAALVAAGDFRATPGRRVVVQVVAVPGAAPAQARFTPAGLPR